MKKILLLFVFTLSFIGYSQYEIKNIDSLFYKINTADDAKFYRDSLQNEYNKESFYSFNDKGEKVDGEVLLSDLDILYERLAKIEIEAILEGQRIKILKKADENYQAKNYKKAYEYYVRLDTLYPKDKFVLKRMKKLNKKMK